MTGHNQMIWVLFSVVVIFNGLDVYQTWLLLEAGLSEANPILCFLINKFGFFMGAVPIKILFIGLLGVGIALRRRTRWHG